MRLRVACLVTVLGLGISAASAARTVARRPVRSVPTFALPSTASGCAGASPGGGHTTRIPARVSHVGPDVGVLVNVCIDGKGPFPFVVDTGADSVTMTTALANRLGLPRVGKPQTFSGVGCTGRGQERRITSWDLEGVPLRGQIVTAADLPHFGGTGQPDGVLGSDVLAAFGAVRIDFRNGDLIVPGGEQPLPKKERIVSRPSSAPLPAGLVDGRPRITAPMRVDSSPEGTVISVKIALGSRPAEEFTPDTGASASIVDTGYARKAKLRPTDIRARENTACSTVTLRAARSGRWSLAGHPLFPQPLLETDLVMSGPYLGLLGADQMSRFGSVVFDYRGGRFILGAG